MRNGKVNGTPIFATGIRVDHDLPVKSGLVGNPIAMSLFEKARLQSRRTPGIREESDPRGEAAIKIEQQPQIFRHSLLKMTVREG
jgi:hypothetical protein